MTAETLTIPPEVARRFVLGRQGLWPGRRWQGQAGTESAMLAVEHLQLDPLTMITRSQDLMLHSRVADYAEEGWQQPAYGERRFFDWGGWLAVRPMSELPYFRHVMLEEAASSRFREWGEAHAGLLDEMRAMLRESGPLSNRDFDMGERRRVDSYRGRKDSSVALYHLWRTGEIMVHDRKRFERVYDLTERIAPAEFIREAGWEETYRFMALKNTAFYGLGPEAKPFYGLSEPSPRDDAGRVRSELVEAGQLVPVRVEGARRPQLMLARDLPLLETLLRGGVPAEWQPLGPTTEEQVSFLAPLDPVSARGRALPLFGFDYTWEVYVPAEKRRWGYYTLPILWGDRLVARADMKFDRPASTLQVLGFWLEDKATGQDGDFARALGRGLGDMQRFLGARRLDIKAIRPVVLRNEAKRAARDQA